MPDIQGDLLQKEMNVLGKAPKTVLKIVCFVFDRIPKFPDDIIGMKDSKPKRGQQSIKSLIGSGAKIESLPITDGNIRDFRHVARAYGVDYSLKKVIVPQEDGTNREQYNVYFKAKSVNVIQSALNEYASICADPNRKKSLDEQLKRALKIMLNRDKNRQRSRQKVKTRGQER